MILGFSGSRASITSSIFNQKDKKRMTWVRGYNLGRPQLQQLWTHCLISSLGVQFNTTLQARSSFGNLTMAWVPSCSVLCLSFLGACYRYPSVAVNSGDPQDDGCWRGQQRQADISSEWHEACLIVELESPEGRDQSGNVDPIHAESNKVSGQKSWEMRTF
jgi:hypothetical protein